MMEIITFMLITLTCMSWFLVGCTYRYKERYKMYHKKLFHQEEQERPPSWGISREQNHNTWIASNATILPGVVIPSNCIIAAGAVVANSLTDENALYGGNPARFIKFLE